MAQPGDVNPETTGEFSVQRVSWVMNIQVVVAITLILICFGAWNTWQTRDALMQRLNDQAHNTLTRLDQSLRSPLWSFDDETVMQVLRAEMQSAAISGIIVRDSNGSAVSYGVGRAAEGSVETATTEPAEYSFRLTRVITFESAAKESASLELYVNDTDVERLLSESLWRQILQVVGLVLALALLISFLLRGSVIRPMQRIHEAKERAQQETLENMQRLEKLKDQFLANTSHELRTPLNGMMGLAEGLLADKYLLLSQQHRESLRMIVSSGRRLANLVNDILDFSKMRHEELQLRVQSLDLRSYSDLVVNVLKPLADNKGIGLHNRIGEKIAAVMADEMRLQQVLHNLLGNAIKFTDKGSVTLAADLRDGMVHVSITDTGIGISKESIGQIFESFNQGDGGISRTYGGTGLGLSITRQIVELQGGTITVQSTPGQGSVFTFTLPISTSGERKTAELGAIASGVSDDLPLMIGDTSASPLAVVGDSPFAGSRILVVDDEPVNRQVLRTQLSSEGYVVTECPGGVEALELCEKGLDVDIILLDVMMPKVNGYDVCKRVRSQFSRQQLPIVFLTARTQAEDIVSGLACGANDYLAKPFSRDELVERVRIHLQIVKARQELEQQNDQLVDAQKKMLSQEKMATLGLLSAGLAHEINNPNNFVKTSAENLKYDLGKFENYLGELMSDDADPEIRDEFAKRFSGFSHHLDLVREGCVRIADIVQSMRNSSRKDAELSDNVDIIAHLEKTLTLVKTTYKNTARFDLEIDARPLLRCSSGQMNQVFLNLLVNACHAIESRQEATGVRDQGVVKVLTRAAEGVLAIGIKDNGCGMTDAVKQKLFEPFFTTKGAVKGTGLGMSISREIVEATGGKIEVISEEGVGTEIWIRLPLPDVGMQRTA